MEKECPLPADLSYRAGTDGPDRFIGDCEHSSTPGGAEGTPSQCSEREFGSFFQLCVGCVGSRSGNRAHSLSHDDVSYRTVLTSGGEEDKAEERRESYVAYHL